MASGNYAAPPRPIAIDAVVKKGEGLAPKSLTKYRDWLTCRSRPSPPPPAS